MMLYDRFSPADQAAKLQSGHLGPGATFPSIHLSISQDLGANKCSFSCIRAINYLLLLHDGVRWAAPARVLRGATQLHVNADGRSRSGINDLQLHQIKHFA